MSRRPVGSRRERWAFLAHNLVAALGTGLAGIFGLLLQAVLTHRLRPLPYGQMLAVFTFFTLVTQPAAAFSRMVAWQTSRDLAVGDGAPASGALLRSANRRLMAVGTVVGLGFAAAAPLVAGFLHVPADFVAIGAICVPFTLATPALLGAVQGEQRFATWGALVAATAGSRIVCAAALVVPFGVRGALGGISLASILVYLGALLTVRGRLRAAAGGVEWRRLARFLVVSIASTVMVSMLLFSDVIMVQHYFSGRRAGEFGAMAVASRALFFAMGSVGAVLFPKVAARQATRRSTLPVVAASLGLALGGGLVGWVAFSVGAHQILGHFAGHAYVAGSSYIGLYALSMPLLAGAAMLSNTQQSFDRLRLLWVLLPAAALKPVLIALFHSSLQAVVVASDVAAAVALLALAVLYVIEERPGALSPRTLAAARARLAERLRLAAPRWRVAGGLAALGVLLRHAWLTTTPLSSGDWSWPDTQRLAAFWPWGSIWDSTVGLGGQNRFLDAFRFPLQSLSGMLAQLGVGWSWSEKLFYFVPYAVLLPLAGWLFAREVMGRTRWALLAPLILLGNTYFLQEGSGEVPLALAEVTAVLALVAFLRAMRRHELGWALACGLLLGATAAFDVRGAYLAVLLAGLCLLVLSVAERAPRLVLRRVLLLGVALACFGVTQLFWIVPLLTYHGNPGFPVPQEPDFNILTLGHGIAGVGTSWTAGTPATLVQTPLDPLFMVVPLVALAPLLARRLRPEVVWLALVAVLFAFFAKTDTPPLGGLYDWMYLHVPGWKLFREGSKFLFCVVVAEAVLVPVALRLAVERASQVGPRLAGALRSGAAFAGVAVLALSAWSTGVLEAGSLASTTAPTPLPASFARLSQLLAADGRPGAVAYFGQPVIAAGGANHRFLVASATHPAVNLTGSFNDTRANRRDPFQSYCLDQVLPYCYVDPQLLPYLLDMAEVGWVVAPAGRAAGSLPTGVTRGWLQRSVSAVLGAPTRLGSGETALVAWRVPLHAAAVSAYPAVALVDSGPWSTLAVLPALRAMGVPAAYRQTFDSTLHPAAPAGLPDSVTVLPATGGGCASTRRVRAGVMAESTAASLAVSVAGAPRTLPLLSAARALPGWGVYGPVDVGAGVTALGAAGGVALGPCVEWSPLAASLLGGALAPTTVGEVHTASGGEVVAATLSGARPAWVELRRPYDPGWRLGGQRPTAVGDGVFTLYHPRVVAAGGRLTFQFSTLPWERVGQVASALLVLLAVVVMVRRLWWRRREASAAPLALDPPLLESPVAGRVAAAGLLLLVFSSLAVGVEWVGLPSGLAGIQLAADPYGLDVGFGAAALAVLGLSILVRCAARLISGRAPAGIPVRGRRWPRPVRRPAAALLALLSLLVLTSCGSSTVDALNQLADAEQAGQEAPALQVGSSLDDARLQRAVRDAQRCVADYTAALATFTDLASAYAGRAACYLGGGGDAPAAVHDFTQALALRPDDPDLFLGRAAADRSSGNVAAAAADYRTAATVPTAAPDRVLGAVDGLLNLDRDADALAVLATGTSRYPQSSTLHLAAADIAVYRGDDARAAAELEMASKLATTPGQHAAVSARACHVDVLQHRDAAALDDCSRAAQAGDDRAGAYDDRATAELALGNPGAALLDLDRAIGAYTGRVGPDAQPSGVHGFGLAVLEEAKGWTLVELHRSGEAVAAFRRAAASLPSTAPDRRARLKADIATALTD